MAYHNDNVCGGGCVGAQQNSRTIPTVQNLRCGSFFVPAQTQIGVKLLTIQSVKMQLDCEN